MNADSFAHSAMNKQILDKMILFLSSCRSPKTQNRAAVRNKTIIHDYTKALNSINNTEWIQKLLR
jgi:hypothetical protein